MCTMRMRTMRKNSQKLIKNKIRLKEIKHYI